jgi:hypothetical protein
VPTRRHKSKAQICFEYLGLCADPFSGGPANQSSPKMVMHIRALPCWPNLSLVLEVQMHDEKALHESLKLSQINGR